MPTKTAVVMLVDDEPRILSALRRALRRESYEIVLVESAQEALAHLAKKPVSVVVSDYKMPGMSGVALLTRIAKEWPTTRRILLSGWSNEIDQGELDASRLTALLTKPWDDDELKNSIRSALAC